MSARRQMTVMAVLLAALVLALLAGLALLQGARGPAPPAAGGDAAPSRAARPVPPAPERTLPQARAAEVPRAPAAGGPAGPFRLSAAVAFEDGTPCDEGSFLDMVRGEDGTPEVSLDPAMGGGSGSPEAGAFVLSWEARPAEILLLFVSAEVEAVSVSGGDLLAPDAQGAVVLASGAEDLRVAVRWRAGCGTVRVTSRATGEVLERPSGPILRWRLGDGSLQTVPIQALGTGEPGRYRVHPPRPVEGPLQPEDPPVLEVLAEGYGTARIPLAEVRGIVEVSLGPAVADLTGDLVVPGAARAAFPVGWILLPATKEAPRPAGGRGTIAGAGPFSLYDVPDGRWTLEVWALTRDGIRWGARTFEKSGGPVALGAVEVSGNAGFRVRVLDADGKPMRVTFNATPVLRGTGGGAPFQIVTLEGNPVRGVFAIRDGVFERLDPDEGAAPAFDDDGWFLLRDLRPGARYRIEASRPAGTSVEADAPAASGEFKDVEIRVSRRPVRCTLRFTVRGEAPEEWGVLFGTGLPLEGWRGDGTYEGPVYPGAYGIQANCRRKGGTGMRAVAGRVEIPEGGTFEATVDLR